MAGRGRIVGSALAALLVLAPAARADAWFEFDHYTGEEFPQGVVLADLRHHHAARISSGRDIDPHSLTREGGKVWWMRAGERVHA